VINKLLAGSIGLLIIVKIQKIEKLWLYLMKIKNRF